MNAVLLTADIGLSFCKVAVSTAESDLLSSEGAPTPVCTPGPGRSEMPMEALWQTVAGLIRRVLEAVPERTTVAAVGISGHGNGAYFVDADGQTRGQAVTSMDTAAAEEMDRLPEQNRSVLTALTLQQLWAGQPGMILRRLKRTAPERYARIGQVLSCKDFIAYRLTGQCHTDYGDVSAAGLLDIRQNRYAPELFAALELPELAAKLPPVLRSSDCRGGVTPEAASATGIPAGTPVIGGMFDVDACIYGAGIARSDDPVCSIAGTWNINAAVAAVPEFHPTIRQCVRRGDGKALLLIDSSATSAVNIEWLMKIFFAGSRRYDELADVLRRVRRTGDSPYWLPFVNGSLGTAASRGAWIGIHASHRTDDLMAAVAEGMAFAHRFHLENLARAGAAVSGIRLTGGAATPEFGQLLADVCGQPVTTVTEKQSGAAGLRAAARVALGLAPTLADAVSVTVDGAFQPIAAEHDLYNQRYQRFKELLSCPL